MVTKQRVGIDSSVVPMTLSLECRTSRDAPSDLRHDVTIGADWSVELPHDLEAERVAVALGAYCSCVELVDKAIPALREALPFFLRRERVALVRDKRGAWRLPASHRVKGCCSATSYRSVYEALHHLRSAEHLATASGASLWLCHALMDAVADAWGGRRVPVDVGDEVASLVLEHDGVARLWLAGIHPDEIAGLAAPAAGLVESLPANYYLEVVYGEVDTEWLRGVLAARPDAETLTWLASLDGPQHSASAAEWAQWLRFGLPRQDVRGAVESGMASDFVKRIAALTGWPLRMVARAVIDFADIGTRPAPSHFETMSEHGIESPRPSMRAVDELEAHLKRKHPVLARTNELPSRTELAVMLVILGTKRDVANAVARGARCASDLVPVSPSFSALLT